MEMATLWDMTGKRNWESSALRQKNTSEDQAAPPPHPLPTQALSSEPGSPFSLLWGDS